VFWCVVRGSGSWCYCYEFVCRNCFEFVNILTKCFHAGSHREKSTNNWWLLLHRKFLGTFFKQECKNYMRSPLFVNDTLILKSESFVFINPALCRRKADIRREYRNFPQHPLFYMVMKLGLSVWWKTYTENNVLRITQEFESMA
jgi:hypothetical protein